MFYDLNPCRLNSKFRAEMCESWFNIPAPLLTHDNGYCGCFFD